MSGKPAARLGDPTACRYRAAAATQSSAARPTSSSTIGPPPARATPPAARLSANVIANVLISSKPATVVGSVGTHGDLVVGGANTVLIGNSGGGAPLSPPSPHRSCACVPAAGGTPQPGPGAPGKPRRRTVSRLQPALAAPAGQPPVRPGGRRPPDPGHPPGKAAGKSARAGCWPGRAGRNRPCRAGPDRIHGQRPLSSSGEFLGWLRDWDRRSPMASWLWSRASFENLAETLRRAALHPHARRPPGAVALLQPGSAPGAGTRS